MSTQYDLIDVLVQQIRKQWSDSFRCIKLSLFHLF